jgi:hypothetical protein
MGDDEFFSNAASSTAPRNPLTLDEVTAFSRKLLNIAFTLYWRDDQINVQKGVVSGINISWEGVREKVTKCLLAIHAREYAIPCFFGTNQCVYGKSVIAQDSLLHPQAIGSLIYKSTCSPS